MAREIYGYLVPDDATTYSDWGKDPATEKIMTEAYRRLSQSLNCSAVADWLNQQNVPVGPYCRTKKWSGHMVRRLFKNPVLKGKPARGFKHTVKHHESGRRRSVTNPHGPTFQDFPQLAFFAADELDSLNARLDEKNAKAGRRRVDGVDPLCGVPRKRTRFPGQHARCWYCGRPYVWGANGITASLMCSGAREWRCWNSIGFNGELLARRLAEQIVAGLRQMKGFESQFAEMVHGAREESQGGAGHRWGRLTQRELQHAKSKSNLMSAIAVYGPSAMIQEKLADLEKEASELRLERGILERLQTRCLEIPESLTDISNRLEDEFIKLAIESPEFGDLLRRLAPDISIHLVRRVDGGNLLPRARVRLNLAGSIDGIERAPTLCEWLTRTWTIDLFDPCQRATILPGAVELATGPGTMTYDQIAANLPERPTGTAVGRALALHRKMQALGLTEPYQIVVDPPDDFTKLRRQRNARYQFEMLEGYERPPL